MVEVFQGFFKGFGQRVDGFGAFGVRCWGLRGLLTKRLARAFDRRGVGKNVGFRVL